MRKNIFKAMYREMQMREFEEIEAEPSDIKLSAEPTAEEFLMMIEKRNRHIVCNINSKSIKRFNLLRELAIQYAERNAMDIEISESQHHDMYIDLRFEFLPHTDNKSVLEKMLSLCDEFSIISSEKRMIVLTFKIAIADKYLNGEKIIL